MSPKSTTAKKPAEQVIKDIRRATRRHFSAEDKLDVILTHLLAGAPPEPGVARYNALTHATGESIADQHSFQCRGCFGAVFMIDELPEIEVAVDIATRGHRDRCVFVMPGKAKQLRLVLSGDKARKRLAELATLEHAILR